MPISSSQEFEAIKAAFVKFEQDLLSEGKLPMRTTNTGFWGASVLDVVFHVFHEVQLQSFKHFLDLGSGDGRVVLVASLFTKATGVESDIELVDNGIEIRDNLKLKAGFLHKDFLDVDFSSYDFFFINPDHRFSSLLEDKLLREASGEVLFVYNHVFAPEKLKKGKTHWFGQIPIIQYDIVAK